jgi:polyhydroxybutyrate depolymerase
MSKKIASIFKYMSLLVLLLAMSVIFLALTSRDRDVLFSPNKHIISDGLRRSFVVSRGSSKPAKLIIALHGFGGNGRQFAYYTALHNSLGSDAVVVYPDAIRPPKDSGLKSGWNAGFCCGSDWKRQIDDVSFLIGLIDQETKAYNIPVSNVYIVGFSNGAFMAQRMAAEKPEIVRAVASVSGTIGTTKSSIQPTQPLPILLMHGEQDKRVTFNGGASPTDPEFEWLSFNDTLSKWQKINQCTPDIICNKEVRVVLYEHDGHIWHDWRLGNFWHQKTQASEVVTKFIESQGPRP